MTAAAVWHDYVTVESDRLTFSVALAADKHGAALANYEAEFRFSSTVSASSACELATWNRAGRWTSPPA